MGREPEWVVCYSWISLDPVGREKTRGNSYGSFQQLRWQTQKTTTICKQIYLGSVRFFNPQCRDSSFIVFLPTTQFPKALGELR